MRKYNINNLNELQATIHRLKSNSKEAEITLKQDFHAYTQTFTLGNIVAFFFNRDHAEKKEGHTDLVGTIMSVLLPVALNKTIFRGAGMLSKLAVSLISRKAGSKIDSSMLIGLVEQLKDWIKPKNKEKKNSVPQFKDYGIPPDSETF